MAPEYSLYCALVDLNFIFSLVSFCCALHLCISSKWKCTRQANFLRLLVAQSLCTFLQQWSILQLRKELKLTLYHGKKITSVQYEQINDFDSLLLRFSFFRCFFFFRQYDMNYDFWYCLFERFKQVSNYLSDERSKTLNEIYPSQSINRHKKNTMIMTRWFFVSNGNSIFSKFLAFKQCHLFDTMLFKYE